MSKQELVVEPVSTIGGGCCAPLINAPLAPDDAIDLAKAFKALGDPVRLRLLSLITSADGESCVCDLTAAFELTGPTISHHLKVLRESGLVDCQRRGTWVYYWPINEKLAQLSALIGAPGLASTR